MIGAGKPCFIEYLLTTDRQVFTTSGWAVGRCALSYVEGQREMKTVDECVEKVNNLCEKGKRDFFEPESMLDFTEWQAKYVLSR